MVAADIANWRIPDLIMVKIRPAISTALPITRLLRGLDRVAR